jgi:hypothetical protein
MVREVYVARFGDSAAAKIEAAVPEGERQTLARNLARRPAGSEPLSVVDYLYLAQLAPILFTPDVQQEARSRFSGAQDPKQRLLAAVSQIVPGRSGTRSLTFAKSILIVSFARMLPARTCWRR